MLTQEQLADRKNQIGGSDIGSIMGFNPYKTALEVWAEKTGAIEPKDLSDNESVRTGNDLEDIVCRRFTEEKGLKIRRDNRTFKHEKYTFLVAHIDRRIVGSDEIVEAKTGEIWNRDKWKDGQIPRNYEAQCQWYLGITKSSKCWIICKLGFSHKPIIRQIEFNEKEYNEMIDFAVEFWNEYVLKNIAPVAVAEDSGLLVDLHPSNKTEELIVANEEVENMIALLQEEKMHKKGGEKTIADLENKIKQIIGDNTGLKTEKYIVTWKTQNGAPKYLKAQMINDGVFDDYTEETTRRVMRVKLNKGE